jgi:hypothetical protein
MDAVNNRDATPAAEMFRRKREHFALAGDAVAPSSETERRLLEIWERVLDIEGLGVRDDFFELGGESLAAVALFTEMERVLGQIPPLSSLLECPTIRLLAGRLDQLGTQSPRQPAAPGHPKG